MTSRDDYVTRDAWGTLLYVKLLYVVVIVVVLVVVVVVSTVARVCTYAYEKLATLVAE